MELEITDIGDRGRGEDVSPRGLGAPKDCMNVLDVDAECLRGCAGDGGAGETLVRPEPSMTMLLPS